MENSHSILEIFSFLYFKPLFAWFGGFRPGSRPFLIYQPIKIKTSYEEFGLLLFWSCEMTQSKKCKHLLKITRLQYTVILSKSWKGLELVSSRRNRVKDKLKMFVIRCINIWTNFTLILHMALNKQLTV